MFGRIMCRRNWSDCRDLLKSIAGEPPLLGIANRPIDLCSCTFFDDSGGYSCMLRPRKACHARGSHDRAASRLGEIGLVKGRNTSSDHAANR